MIHVRWYHNIAAAVTTISRKDSLSHRGEASLLIAEQNFTPQSKKLTCSGDSKVDFVQAFLIRFTICAASERR